MGGLFLPKVVVVLPSTPPMVTVVIVVAIVEVDPCLFGIMVQNDTLSTHPAKVGYIECEFARVGSV